MTTICKQITAVSKNVYVDKLDEKVDKYNKTYHRKINMKMFSTVVIRSLLQYFSNLTQFIRDLYLSDLYQCYDQIPNEFLKEVNGHALIKKKCKKMTHVS